MLRDAKGQFAKKTKKVTVTLKNGLEISGPEDKITQMAKEVNLDLEALYPPELYHKSKSEGYIRYTDMATGHLKNLVLQIYIEDIKKMAKSKTGKDFVEALTTFEGLDTNTRLTHAMAELQKRNNL